MNDVALKDIISPEKLPDILTENRLTLLRCKNGYQVCFGDLAGSAIGTEHSLVCETVERLLEKVKTWADHKREIT